jgi:hypothetical protein
MKKAALLCAVLNLTFAIVLLQLAVVPNVAAEGTVYIGADGSVEGTTAIRRDGNVYTLTGNISGGVQVQQSNIVIDGAGYTVQGSGINRGIDLSNNRGSDPSQPTICNVTVKNTRIVNFSGGIETANSKNAVIIGNYIADCFVGINIMGDLNNVLIKNNTIANNVNGVSIAYGGANQTVTITENNMINDKVSSNNVLTVWLSPQPLVEYNYWSDYSTKYPNAAEAGNSGTWDTPYHYSGAQGHLTDDHPLMTPVSNATLELPEWAYPSPSQPPPALPSPTPSPSPALPLALSILSPANTTYTTDDIPLTCIVDNRVLCKLHAGVDYSLDGSGNRAYILGNTTLPSLPEGSHCVTVYAYDGTGNEISETVYFSVETPEPFPTVPVAAAIIAAVIVVAGLLVYFKRRNNNTWGGI